MNRLILLLVVCLLLIGCSEQKSTSTSKEIEIFYYYSPKCPACRMVKPYMELLKENVRDVRFYFCNVYGNCSEESVEIAKKYPFQYIPTVILIAGNDVVKLTGCYEVLKLGEILKSYGIETPKVVMDNVSYSVDECIKCHERRGLPPPTNFSCSYCCHKARG